MAWDEVAHPRSPAGQFAPLGYDAAKNTGTGYGKKKGDDRVRAAQTALNALGLKDASGKPLKLDGKLGPRTTAALKRYQKANGLKADGKITPKLLAVLKKAGTGKKGSAKPRTKKSLAKGRARPKASSVVPTRNTQGRPQTRFEARVALVQQQRFAQAQQKAKAGRAARHRKASLARRAK